MSEFADQTAIVVGAARGIGRAAAERLAGQGARVVGFDRDEAALQATTSALVAEGLNVTARPVDVTDDRATAAAVEATLAEGPVQILVNCAGITGETNRKPHQVDPEDFDRVYRVNLRAAFLLTRLVAPAMVAQGYGRMLHVASMAGKEGNAGMLAYSATKAGLIGLVKSAGKDYADTGVTINALAPAVIRTDMVAAVPAALIKDLTDRIPMRRTGRLDEVAAMIAFIVSPACGFCTGFTFDLSGGRATY
ncbi:MAG: SDR family NAD(P)-dependent oxidoreductase [Kiloniellales bacterium]